MNKQTKCVYNITLKSLTHDTILFSVLSTFLLNFLRTSQEHLALYLGLALKTLMDKVRQFLWNYVLKCHDVNNWVDIKIFTFTRLNFAYIVLCILGYPSIWNLQRLAHIWRHKKFSDAINIISTIQESGDVIVVVAGTRTTFYKKL